MNKILNLLLLVAITFGLSTNLYGGPVNKNVYETKSKKYYAEFKKEWFELPEENKKRILSSFQQGLVYDMSYTLAATKFLENRGMKIIGNKNAINVNKHKGGYVTYDCGDYGINTMTYLKSIGKGTKDISKHKQACNKLVSDKQLNLSMALDTYNYALDRYDGNTLRAWNYYNTGRDSILGERIYHMKGFIMVLQEEIKNTKYVNVASNDIKNNKL